MLVPVRVEGANNEWSIVELQGALLSDDGATVAGGLTIGALRFVDGVPTLRIGNHILAGKVAKLPKPLAILRKDESADGANSSSSSSEPLQLPDRGVSDSSADMDVDMKQSNSRVEYEVVGIARSRVVFSSRPKPVLTE